MSTKYEGPMKWADTTRPTKQWIIDEEDDPARIYDLDYDFEGYFDRYEKKALTNVEEDDFWARVYGLFCRDVFKSGGEPAAVAPWVARAVAERLYDALKGRRWSDAMKLPWDEPTDEYTRRGKRAMGIWSDVSNALKSDPSASVTALLREQAEAHHVSYESARGDYYTIKGAMDYGEGLPASFLISDPDI